MKNRTIYLTFDIDWASDEVISYLLDVLEYEQVAATIFITHETNLLDRMRKNPLIELGAHPNFVPLSRVDFDVCNFQEWARTILEKYKKLVPEATSIRSHGLTQNSRLLDLCHDMGYKRESNLLITLSSGIVLNPFYHWNGLIRVPYFWEDDIHCTEIKHGTYNNWDIWPFVYSSGMKMFDFHPIHIFLNTDELNRYESARPYFHDKKLVEYRNTDDVGDYCFLVNLIKFGKDNGYIFKKVNEIEVI